MDMTKREELQKIKIFTEAVAANYGNEKGNDNSTEFSATTNRDHRGRFITAAAASASAYAQARNRKGSIPKTHAFENSKQKQWRLEAEAFLEKRNKRKGQNPPDLLLA